MDEVKKGAILGVDHVSVVVADAQVSAAFYRQVLGLVDADRPDLGFPGAWLRLSGTITLHLLELPNPDPATGRPEHGGRDRHVALRVADTAPFIARLDDLSWPYTRSKSGRDAVFFRDPDGNALELVGLAA